MNAAAKSRKPGSRICGIYDDAVTILRWTLRIAAPLSVATLVACAGEPNRPPEAAAPGPTSGTLMVVGSMSSPRSNHTETLLSDGEVLLAGGGSPETATRSAEVFDPRSGRTRRVADMGLARLSHTASLLPDGRVLVVGGLGAAADSAEIYDPVVDRFAPAGPLSEPRSDHAAVTLASGEILIVGGDVSGVGATPTAGAEIYDPSTHRFTPTGRLGIPRRPYGVVRLPDDRVLVAGGTTTGKQVVASAEIYDRRSGRFAPAGDLATARHKHAAAVLPDGRALIMGGTTGSNDSIALSSAELFDPAAGRFLSAAPMHFARYKTTAVSLPDGSVLVVGGSSAELVEVYDPRADRFSTVAGGSQGLRFFPTAALLLDGSVLIGGGYSERGAQSTLWRFTP